MRVGLFDCDKTNFPNLALMKLSTAYKAAGHTVEPFSWEAEYDKVVASKVFTWTEDTAPAEAIRGGTGYFVSEGSHRILPEFVEHICPDYSLYGIDYSIGFVTRGCPRKCGHCLVPEKEGKIVAHADVEEFLRHDSVVLMDNNILAHPHGIYQLEKLSALKVKVDINQGLDARLIGPAEASLLASLKWLNPLRLACDSQSQKEPVRKAVEELRWANCTPTIYSCYTLIKDVDEALDRIRFLKGMKIDPFAQPYRSLDGTEPSREQRRLARWVNTKKFFKTMTWEEYKQWRGDRI